MTAASPNPGLVFFQRAAARLVLVNAGEMDIETTIIELVEPFEHLVGLLLCDCSRDIAVRWERDHPPVRNERPPSTQPTPQATIEAIMFCVRERGVQALKEPTNIERLSCCDEAAKAQLDARIEKWVKEVAPNG